VCFKSKSRAFSTAWRIRQTRVASGGWKQPGDRLPALEPSYAQAPPSIAPIQDPVCSVLLNFGKLFCTESGADIAKPYRCRRENRPAAEGALLRRQLYPRIARPYCFVQN